MQGRSKCRQMHRFHPWLANEETECIHRHLKACYGCLEWVWTRRDFLMLRNGHVMIILLTFDFAPCQWQLMHRIFSLTSKEKIWCVTWHFKVPLCWSYWTSLSQMRSANVVKLALDDYFVDFHQRVITSDNWCLGSSLWHLKRRSGASIGISRCMVVVLNELEPGEICQCCEIGTWWLFCRLSSTGLC